MIDYDIKNWNLPPLKYIEHLSKSKKYTTKSIWNLRYSCLNLYALFRIILKAPNGIYTIMKEGMPLDNPIWWDFAIEHPAGFIHLVRTCKQLEITYYHNDESFNIHQFLQKNLEKYREEINGEILKFEKHIVYINHYKSYLNSIENLEKEIKEIDLQEPETIAGHLISQEKLELYTNNLENYTNNLTLFHPKAKSLLLNTAFMIESFINIVIRIGIKKELIIYTDVLKKYLNTSFKDKLQNIKFYTLFFKKDIDLELQVVKDVLELMSIRNKYVHFDEYSKINILGEEYFDDSFPLFDVTKKTFQIEVLQKTYLNPSKETIDKHYKNAFEFKDYIYSIIDDKYVDAIKKLVQVNPLSYNTKRNVYSSIFPSAIMEFYLPQK
ncbi:hypothetical protein [Chryseobacterium indologenes]|uniref:hypothetical protein n=1 Tax=Chryseobacterium indologenes TaxID=253 RepID=UPI001BCBE684|nr:hypothetical protein [Chryseobacterium indologenes]